jgi:hypothetical protein
MSLRPIPALSIARTIVRAIGAGSRGTACGATGARPIAVPSTIARIRASARARTILRLEDQEARALSEDHAVAREIEGAAPLRAPPVDRASRDSTPRRSHAS